MLEKAHYTKGAAGLKPNYFFKGALKHLFPNGLSPGIPIEIVSTQGSLQLAFEFIKEFQQLLLSCCIIGFENINLASLFFQGINLNDLVLIKHEKNIFNTVLKIALEGFSCVAIPGHLIEKRAFHALIPITRLTNSTLVIFKLPQPLSSNNIDWYCSIRLYAKHLMWEGIDNGYGYIKRRLAKVTMTDSRYNKAVTQALLWLPDSDNLVKLAKDTEIFYGRQR